MPTVHLVPVKRGMQPEEVVGRIQGGWQLLGRQAVEREKAGGIATLDNPAVYSLEDADVWMLAEPMIPQAMVASLIVQAMSAEDPLDYLAQELYGTDLGSLSRALEEAMVAQGQHSSED